VGANLGANGMLFVAVEMGSAGSLTSVTYDSDAMTFIGDANSSYSGSTRRVESWGLLNPPPGTAAILATVAASGTSTMVGNSISFGGAKQTFNTPVTVQASTALNMVELINTTTAPTDLVLAVLCARITAGLVPMSTRALVLWENVPSGGNVYSKATLESGHVGSVSSGFFWGTADAAAGIGLVINAVAND
jgi:hypothetical protein